MPTGPAAAVFVASAGAVVYAVSREAEGVGHGEAAVRDGDR
ncbi:hypothetical protein ACWEOE_29580 [Amycolatopsis sp. NPDC004368]